MSPGACQRHIVLSALRRGRPLVVLRSARAASCRSAEASSFSLRRRDGSRPDRHSISWRTPNSVTARHSCVAARLPNRDGMRSNRDGMRSVLSGPRSILREPEQGDSGPSPAGVPWPVGSFGRGSSPNKRKPGSSPAGDVAGALESTVRDLVAYSQNAAEWEESAPSASSPKLHSEMVG